MSDVTDPDDPIPPRRPERRRGLGLMFWVVMLFGLLCILAGAAIATYGPRLFPVKPAAPAAPPAEAAPTGASVQINSLAERVDRVEGGQQRLSRAAASALAAAALTD